ncbi:MAG TPA: quinone oxidoreductase [Candidatus Limnocylindria bacterium]|nr:quinone oxidoreductase [Candidatus Limnocylindria bacterium]
MKAIRVHTAGGPEAMTLDDIPQPVPKADEALVKIDAAGLNYIDVYFRTGQYKAELPLTLGLEAGGTVTAVGPGATDVKVGDKVAYTGVPGAYAEYAVVPAARLVVLPAGLTTRQGAAMMLQGMTAHYLATSTYPLKKGDTCLVHAAAGGVGLLLCQIAKLRGARVIGTVSTDEKAKLAREAGADEVILYSRQDFEAEVKRLTDGKLLQVVYDGVGKTTFEKGFNCLAPRGMMVLYGAASGPIGTFDPQILNVKGSLFLTRPSLNHHIITRAELVQRATEIGQWITDGRLKLRVEFEFPLKDAAEAHRSLEGRKTTGKVLIVP